MDSIPASRYLPFFKEHGARLRDQFELIGDILLVERVKFPEQKTASGLIIADYKQQIGTLTADKPVFYRVLLTGEGYYDDKSDTADTIPLNTQQGDIILVGAVSVKVFSSFPMLEKYEADSFGLTRETDVQWRFKSEDAFKQFLRELNDSIAPLNG